MSARLSPLLCAALLVMLVGCAAKNEARPGQLAAHPQTTDSSTPQGTTASRNIDALVAQLKPQLLGAIDAAPDVHAQGVNDMGVMTGTDAGTCPRGGTVSDFVAGVVAYGASHTYPNPEPAVEAFLKADGWRFIAMKPARPKTFDSWDSVATKDGIVLGVQDRYNELTVEATLPCLPGQPLNGASQ